MSSENVQQNKLMRAAYLVGRMQIEVRQLPIPELPPGGMLLKVDSIGLCGSDINRIRYTTSADQRVLGHEVAGEVVAVDKIVTKFKPGDRVAVGHVHVPCGHCIYCRHGNPAMCRQFKETRIVPGGYAEYVAISADHVAHTVLKLPDHVSYAAATFVDPVACCMHAVNLSEIQPLDRVVVVGVGIMGLIFVQLLRAADATTFALDVSDYRLSKALAYGAQHVFNSRGGKLADKILSLTDGEGADVVLLTFLTQEILDDALEYVRDGGRLCVFAPPISELGLKMDYFDFFRRELSMYSSYSATLTEMASALEWITAGKVNVEDMITSHTGLEGMQACVAGLDDRQIKVIVEP